MFGVTNQNKSTQLLGAFILGGIYLRIDNDVIDGTIKTKLDELKNIITRTE